MADRRPPHLQAIIDELQRSGPFETIADVNRALQARMRDYNATPQADLAGLSPNEMGQLLAGDWVSGGALRLNQDLPLHEFAGSSALADARTLLEFFAKEGPVKETAAHYLPPAVVAALRPRLRMPGDGRRLSITSGPAPVKEVDFVWLPVFRQVLFFAKLLTRRQGVRISARGRALLAPERAGQLYALLFRTFFRELDLMSLSSADRHPGLQPTLACSFYKLRTCARGWATPSALSGCAWLDSAKDPPREWESVDHDFRYYTFWQRVIDPLALFGLLEERVTPTKVQHDPLVEYRTTALYDRFLRFEMKALG